jgi:hypothetical protein
MTITYNVGNPGSGFGKAQIFVGGIATISLMTK